jgi:hypothetical protein
MQAAPVQAERSAIQQGREKTIPSDPAGTDAFPLRKMTRRIVQAIRNIRRWVILTPAEIRTFGHGPAFHPTQADRKSGRPDEKESPQHPDGCPDDDRPSVSADGAGPPDT